MHRNSPTSRETLTAWLGIAAMVGSLVLVLALTMGHLENSETRGASNELSLATG